MAPEEQPLIGGNATTGVVRVDSTVLKPWSDSTPAVHDFMRAVADAGVDVPAVMGRDAQGRQILEYVEGPLALNSPALSIGQLSRVGGIVRSIHDASARFAPPIGAQWTTAIPSPGDELICHNDLAPWNLIVGPRWVFIDWDAAGPSTRLWDLAYAAQAFTLLDVRMDPSLAGMRLAAFVDGYGADGQLREELPSTVAERAAAMCDLLHASHLSGRQPWASMYSDFHGDFWRAATEYASAHHDTWQRALNPPETS